MLQGGLLRRAHVTTKIDDVYLGKSKRPLSSSPILFISFTHFIAKYVTFNTFNTNFHKKVQANTTKKYPIHLNVQSIFLLCLMLLKVFSVTFYVDI